MKKEDNNEIVIDNIVIGTMNGFMFEKADGVTDDQLTDDIKEAISARLEAKIDEMIAAGDAALRLEDDYTIRYNHHVVASIKKTDDIFTPDLDILVDDLVQGLPLARLALHVQSRLKRQINLALDPIELVKKIEEPSENITEFSNILVTALGAIPRKKIDEAVKKLTLDEKAKLRKIGVRLAQYSVYLRDIFKPMAQETKIILWSLYNNLEKIPAFPPAGVVTLNYDDTMPEGYYDIAGYRKCGDYVIRLDMIEKLADTLRPLAQKNDNNPEGQFEVTSQHMSLIGKSGEVFEEILKSLGYDFITKEVMVTSVSLNNDAVTQADENNIISETQNADVASTDDAENNDGAVNIEVENSDASDNVNENITVTEELVQKKLWFWRGNRNFEKKPSHKNFLRRDKKKSSDDEQSGEKPKKHFAKKEHDKGGKNRKFDPANKKPYKKPEPSPYVNMPGQHKVSQENNPFAILANLRKEG